MISIYLEGNHEVQSYLLSNYLLCTQLIRVHTLLESSKGQQLLSSELNYTKLNLS